jgi:tetratricopeptide (TPR) repeat protein
MSKYDTDLDYVIRGINISEEELEEIKAEADKIISENKKKEKDEETKKILALAYLKKAQCQRKLESCKSDYIFYEEELGFFMKKEKKDIKKLLKKALKLSPDMPEAIMQLGILNVSGWSNYKNYKSINFISIAIQLKPDYAAALNNRAMLFIDSENFLYEDDKDKIEKAKSKIRIAIADLTEAIKIRPFDAVYHLNRGKFHSRLEEHKEVIEDFSNTINYSSDVLKEKSGTVVKIFNLRGKEYTELKEYGRAIDDFSESLRLIQERDDKFIKSIEDCIEQMDIDVVYSDYFETLLLRGKAYYLSGEKDKAKADIEEYLSRKRKIADDESHNEIIKLTGITPEDILKGE